MLEGYDVECPHLFYPQFLNDEEAAERTMGISFGLIKLLECDMLWYPVGMELSPGMRAEMDVALEKLVPCVGVKVEEVEKVEGGED